MIKAPDQCIHNGNYGTWTYIQKRALERDPGYIIDTEYLGFDSTEVTHESMHTRDKDDWSAPQLVCESECSWCWLGYNHTRDEHERSLKKAAL